MLAHLGLALLLLALRAHGQDSVAANVGRHSMARIGQLLTSPECRQLQAELNSPEEEPELLGPELQEPGAELQEPGAELQEPGAEMEKPGAELEEPGARFQRSSPQDEPRADLEEPGARSQPSSPQDEPGTDLEEPGARSQPSSPQDEPRADLEEPGARSQRSSPQDEPRADLEEPGARSQPSSPQDEPGTDLEEPGARSQRSSPQDEPRADLEEPRARSQRSSPQDEPGTDLEEPGARSQPSSPQDEPGTDLEEPGARSQPSSPVGRRGRSRRRRGCSEALLLWLQRAGEETTWDRLVRALQNIGRSDIARELGKNLNQDRSLELRRNVEGYRGSVQHLSSAQLQPRGRRAPLPTDLLFQRLRPARYSPSLLGWLRPLLLGVLGSFAGSVLLTGTTVYFCHWRRLLGA